MDRRLVIALIGVLAFAVTLGIVVGIRLAGQSMAIVLGVAIGVVVGVGGGVATALVVLRTGRTFYSTGWDKSDEEPTTMIALTADQADVLMQALQKRQTSPEAFTLTAGHQREFSAVGGASFLNGESPDGETDDT